MTIYLSKHAIERLSERVKKMSIKEMVELAKEALDKGKVSINFYDSDPMLFDYMLHKQNKHQGKLLKLYNDILYVFTSDQKVLITCYPLESWGYDKYKLNRAKKLKK